jgi:hypothetical protein
MCFETLFFLANFRTAMANAVREALRTSTLSVKYHLLTEALILRKDHNVPPLRGSVTL